MKALYISGPLSDPADLRRVEQICALLRELGARIDLIAPQQSGAEGVLCRVDRVATVSPPGTAAHIAEAAAVIAGGDMPDLVFLGRDAAAPPLAGRFVLSDETPRPDAHIHLARQESLRADLTAEGHVALRLPLMPPPEAALLDPGQMIGWAGPWPHGLAPALSGVLNQLAEWGTPLPGGLLLAGNGQEEVRVPPVLNRLTVRTASAPTDSLGLALLPLDDVGDAVSLAPSLVDLVALGCPVLTSPQVAAVFEDRWHLPCAPPQDLARLLADTSADALHAGADQTRTAYWQDLKAMTAYVGTQIARRLSVPVRVWQ